MDGVGASASAAANKKPLLQASQNRGSADASIRNLLFEQLLTFSVPVQTLVEPQQSAPELPSSDVSTPKESESPTAERQDEEVESSEDSSIVSITVPDLYGTFKPAPSADNPRLPTNDLCALPKDTTASSPQLKQASPVQVETPVVRQTAEVVADQAIIATEQTPIVDAIQPQSNEKSLTQEGMVPESEARGRKAASHGDPHVALQSANAVTAPARPESQASRDENSQGNPNNQPPAQSPSLNDNAMTTVSTKRGDGERREKWFERESEMDYPSQDSQIEPVFDNEPRQSDSVASQISVPLESSTSSTTTAVSVAPTTPSDTVLATAIAQVQATSMTPNRATSTGISGESTIEANRATIASTDPTAKVVGAKPDAARQTGRTDGQEVNQHERVRLVQRIARSFNRITAEGGLINLRLHPEQLGSLSVQVRLEGKSMSAVLSTETEQARDIILNELPVLRQRLSEQGFEVTRFSVEVSNSGASGNFGQSNDSSQSRSGEQRPSSQMDYRRIASQSVRLQNTETGIPSSWTPAGASTLQAIDLKV